MDLRNPQVVNSTLLQPGLNPRLPALVLALGIKAIKGDQRGEMRSIEFRAIRRQTGVLGVARHNAQYMCTTKSVVFAV